jgi:glycerate 2-kinase
MTVLITPDKFKGTLSAGQATLAIARGWRKLRPNDALELLPMSDGGDGFGEVMGNQLRAKPLTASTVDAAHRRCKATWWWEPKSQIAIIETARVIGLAMLPPKAFHPFELDTFGLGELVRTVLVKGARQIIVGVGGSATNDAGFGLARALGWKFLDQRGQTIERWTHLDELSEIRRPSVRRREKIIVAVDVHNPLLGAHGATRIYGPQKGLGRGEFARAERSLGRLANIIKRQSRREFARLSGAGAAGGLGFGLAVFLNARLEPGFELFAKLAKLKRRLLAADLVITGEGAIDRSTAMGKGVGQVARLCREEGIPCIGLAGTSVRSRAVTRLFTRVYAMTDLTTLVAAKAKPALWLERTAAQAMLDFASALPQPRALSGDKLKLELQRRPANVGA